MTEEEGNYYITLAALHAPATRTHPLDHPIQPTHEPLTVSGSRWLVFRDNICEPIFNTRAEAARHYCRHYGLIKP